MTLRTLLQSLTGQNAVFTVPRLFIELTGDYEAAAFLSQVIYWQGKMNNKEFYKSDADWQNELLISPSKLKRLRVSLKVFGLNVVKKGMPATNHYSVDFKKLEKALTNQSEQNEPTDEMSRQVSPKCANQSEQNEPTSPHENEPTAIYKDTEDYTEYYNKRSSTNTQLISEATESPTPIFLSQEKLNQFFGTKYLDDLYSENRKRETLWPALRAEELETLKIKAKNSEGKFHTNLIGLLDVATSLVKSTELRTSSYSAPAHDSTDHAAIAKRKRELEVQSEDIYSEVYNRVYIETQDDNQAHNEAWNAKTEFMAEQSKIIRLSAA